MAKNLEPEKVVESQSESGDEEEEASSEEGEEADSQESESDSEPTAPTQVAKKASVSTPPTQKKTQPQASVKLQQPASSSEEEEDAGSETESESEPDRPDRPDANVRPLDDPQKYNSGARKPIPKLVSPIKPAAAKRPAEGTELKDAKRAKKKSEPDTPEKKTTDDPKKVLFQRIWSEDDEIAILKGMIDYSRKKKADPLLDLNAFHEFIKKDLHVDATLTQLQHKVRRLRKKFENNKSKEKEGKDRTLSKPHEQKAYELSKCIWGNVAGKENGGDKGLGSPKGNGSGARKAASKRAGNAADSETAKDLNLEVMASGVGGKSVVRLHSIGGLSVEERILAAGAELFEGGKGLEGEELWRKLKVEEAELHLKQLELKTAQARLVLDVIKSGEH